MANFYEKARTNYFTVKDPVAFRAWAKQYQCKVWSEEATPERVCLLWDEDMGFQEYPVDDDYNDVQGSFFMDIAEHLTDDAVCIVMAVGSEKYRYLTGWASAIDNTGYDHMVAVDLDKIYEIAQTVFPNKDINSATY
jgi:hypothetical protein